MSESMQRGPVGNRPQVWQPAPQAGATRSAVREAFEAVLPASPLLRRVAANALGLRQLEAMYAQVRDEDGVLLCRRLLEQLEVTYRVPPRDVASIPSRGPVVLVANHPFGLLEGALLTALLDEVRKDCRFLGNALLRRIPELARHVIAVDPIGGDRARGFNAGGVRQAIEHLSQAGLLVVFPAGEVASVSWREHRLADPAWNPGVAGLLSMAARRVEGLQVVPVHISGTNSALFHMAGLVHPRLRTLMLGRELLNKRAAAIDVRVGAPAPMDKLARLASDKERIEYLRWRTDLLARRQEFHAETSKPLLSRWRKRSGARAEVAPPQAADELEREVEALDPAARLAESGDLAVYLASAAQVPGVLREIGRLREVTFRAAGEGTGGALDLDRFDQHYLHLFAWNAARREVVGAYRLAQTDLVVTRHGIQGLYTATLFDYGPDFLSRLGPSLELGRAFIRHEYQRAFAPLLLLWKAIGRFIANHPQYRVLFGPVSISNRYGTVSRQLMVRWLERWASLPDVASLVRCRNPFKASAESAAAWPAGVADLDEVSSVISDLEPSQPGVPVLLRHYLKLGGRLLGFNVDPKFSEVIDGLILVDLAETEPKLLERYLGRQEAREFLNSHGRHSCNAQSARVQ